MVIWRPDVDKFDPAIAEIVQAYDSRAYADGGGLDFDVEITRQYVTGWRQIGISVMFNDVLSGRWGLGNTVLEVAARLEVDHSSISNAWHWGEASPWLEKLLECWEKRPKDWKEPLKREARARHRRGFMTVVEYLARRDSIPQRPNERQILEVDAELLRAMMEERARWELARASENVFAAHRIIVNVVEKAENGILPPWYTEGSKGLRTTVEALIERLKMDEHFAFEYLCRLQTRWEAYFLAAMPAVENRSVLDELE